ncbi:amino acid adenylation domain-containing protein [Sphaerisporangium corydalis]|uniref:Amino acid adenylation domain-containing protein n=1 Tax=Sphaerisporangium corydalis TaxID=1441875 RepID=A0ABV9EC00_9ACTN|nr:amino acid adenylation domain-containing protein [Sphaerisporangium corydalis]
MPMELVKHSDTVGDAADTRIAEFRPAASDENALIARRFNETTRLPIGDKSLPELLREQVRIRPESTAVVDGDETLTYAELEESASVLGSYLRHLGVAADDCVGVFVEPSAELMIGAWGILYSGGAYLPLSPEYPEERLRFMIEDGPVGIIFTQEALRERLEELAPQGTTIVTFEQALDFAAIGAAAGERDGTSGPFPRDLAYIIYTSGSTGKPKGVMIEHRSIVNQMRWLGAVHGLDQDKIVLQKTPMSFDAAQWEILAPVCGSTVVMGTPGIYRDPERLVETIVRHGVTTLQCVPTLLQALLDLDEIHDCTSLTQVFSGGEALSANLALQCLDTLPGCELVNLYGPTECTINSSSYTVDRASLTEGPNSISIGAPVHNTHYYILDERRSPVGVGEIGELHVGGAQLARGYLHRPDLTADRFIGNPFYGDHGYAKLYKTGDLAYLNPDGTVQFVGRADNQVKLRGFRVELDEIKLAVETHDWVRNAAVIVKNDARTGFQSLIAFVELNPKEAALMDQGAHGAHHQSKESKLQVKAQLSNLGCRDAAEIAGRVTVDLPGKAATDEQRRRVFARKTYRFYEGGSVTKADVLRLLASRTADVTPRVLDELTFAEFGEILRYFGQHLSDERLLPKYGYASPGSLYATQMYLELTGIGGLRPGIYYFHPVHHQLILIRETEGTAAAGATVHFVGKKRAIEPVYKNNIQEVLRIEAGHMVGLFEEVLPEYGLTMRALDDAPATKDLLEVADEDYYLGTFAMVPYAPAAPDPSLETYVQAHPGMVADLPAGQYRYTGGDLTRISGELVLKKHVIAINQSVYQRASIGITVLSSAPRSWSSYVGLGRELQRLQMNDIGMGFMSSGYSSETGNDLPSAKRIESILRACGAESGPSYFFVGGRVSEEQVSGVDMKEDVVHMKGPTELIKDDLVNFLPDYMMPNRVVVLDKLPLTANGKIDMKGLEASDRANFGVVDRPFVAPRTRTEERISVIWKKEMKRDVASIDDDFFEADGNSLIATKLINKINREFGSSLPLQILFEASTIEELALLVDGEVSGSSSRLVRLQPQGTGAPVYCWPGLGGFTMNLRTLAGRMGVERPFYGVQAHGINAGETPYATIREMAAEDVRMIRELQPDGPYTLWGYSFGARVAFETAYQLEQAGQQVENLFLIAPGSPKVRVGDVLIDGDDPSYDNPAYVTILFSVFAGGISGPLLAECLRVATDDDSFTSFICRSFSDLDVDQVRRIVRIVSQTFQLKYTFRELTERRIAAPITIFKAQGDDYSFIEGNSGYSAEPPAVADLEADHYSLLREPDIGELVRAIRHRLGTGPATVHPT